MASLNSIVLCSDAYGGRGGIALYNRNFIKAISSYPNMSKVLVLPRKIYYKSEEMPSNVQNEIRSSKGKISFIFSVLNLCLRKKNIDVIFCTHINLFPLAKLLSYFHKCEVHLLIYGRDAWTKTTYRLTNFLVTKVNSFISMRHYTARKFMCWANLSEKEYYHLPNCIDLEKFSINSDKSLKKRYNLEGKKVILSAGRLDEDDPRKGFDEIIEVLGDIKKKINNVKYVIIGDGLDKERLIKKAKKYNVIEDIVFTGYVSEVEKLDYFNLGDVFAMPGSNKGFDNYPFRFVFLEALACGLKVIGSKLTDEWEINDPDSSIIIQVDPHNKEEIIESIVECLKLDEKHINERLSNFDYKKFEKKVHMIVKNSSIKDGY